MSAGSTRPERRVAPPTPDLKGVAAVPRRNGEPVFDAPWQSRAFGMVLALHEQGHYPWNDFKARLIDQITRADRNASNPDAPGYYDHFVAAFTRLLVENDFLDEGDLDRRTREFKTGRRQEVY